MQYWATEVPGLSQDFIFAVSSELPHPTSFGKGKKNLKKQYHLVPLCHNLYLLTFLKSSWEGGYVVSGDTFPKKSEDSVDVCVT